MDYSTVFPTKKSLQSETPEPPRELGLFARQPSEFIVLNERGQLVSGMAEKDYEKAGLKYISAKCHYTITQTPDGKEEKAYDTNPDHIKEALYMVPDPENHSQGYSYLTTRIERYGIKATNPELRDRW